MADCTDQSSNVVFNSLLCYVITKLRTLETARIRSTMLDFYSADDVSSAKKVLLTWKLCCMLVREVVFTMRVRTLIARFEKWIMLWIFLYRLTSVNCLVHCLVLLLTTLIICRRLVWMLVKCTSSWTRLISWRLFGVQTAVYIVRMIIDQANAAPESNGRFF